MSLYDVKHERFVADSKMPGVWTVLDTETGVLLPIDPQNWKDDDSESVEWYTRIKARAELAAYYYNEA